MQRADASGTRCWVYRTQDHWLQSHHVKTALDAEIVSLARGPRLSRVVSGDPAHLRYGVAWDCSGGMWRTRPDQRRVERWLNREYHAYPIPQPTQDCTVLDNELIEPRGLTIDGKNRLYIADAGSARVLVIDLFRSTLVQAMGPPDLAGRRSRPWDVAPSPDGNGAYVLDRGTRSVWCLPIYGEPQLLLGPGGAWEADGRESLHDPTAILVAPDGAVVVLDRIAGNAPCDPPIVQIVWAYPDSVQTARLGRGQDDLQAADATTMAFDCDGVFVVGGDPDAPLIRYRVVDNDPSSVCLAFHPIGTSLAWGFDGGAVVRRPDGQVVYTPPSGVATPLPEPARYAANGSVTSFALDSGIAGCVWHRLYIEACLPEHTSIEVATRTADELHEDLAGPFVPASLPQGYTPLPRDPDVPMPPIFDPDATDGWMDVPHLLRRPPHADLPLQPDAPSSNGRNMALHEGLVFSPPGRYLWVRIILRGTDRQTPSVRGLRVYFPRPSYLRYLPAVFREDPRHADFLDRLLSIFETFYTELDQVRDRLHLLFGASTTPSETLDWLAGFLGLVLDSRWPEFKRRKLVAQAARLYRQRGTLDGITSFLGLYLDQPFHIIETFRLQQVGGFVAGAGRLDACSNSAESDGLGGSLPWEPTSAGIEDGSLRSVLGAGILLRDTLVQPSSEYAHKFVVWVVGQLSDEQRRVVRHILDMEKPAHTQYVLCEVAEPMIIGVRAQVGINTFLRSAASYESVVLRYDHLRAGWPLGIEPVQSQAPLADDCEFRVGSFKLGDEKPIKRL